MEGSDARERAASAVRATGAGATSARLSALSRAARLALLDDERLALLAARGSKRGFARLRERYEQPLYAYCYLLLRDADDAYDALQATLARAFAEMREGARDELLRPWLFRIAHEQAHMLARAGAWSRAARSTTEQLSALEEAPEQRARLAQLAGDLSELPVVQRSALLMRELTGMRHAEIANALGISRPEVRQSIFLARRSLSEFQLGRSLACEQVCRTLSHGDGRTLRRRTLRAHLRDCSACAEFARAIQARRAELRMLTPALAGPLAASALARVAAGSKPGAGVLAGCTATKTAATTLAAKAAAATASAIALTAGVGAGVAIALVQSEGRPPSAPSPAHYPRKVGAPRPRSSAVRHRDDRRVPRGHGPCAGQDVARAGAPPSSAPPSGSLVPPIAPAGGAASAAADAASGRERAAAGADANAGPGRVAPPGSAGGDASAWSEKRWRGNAGGEKRGRGNAPRGRGNAPRGRGRAKAQGQDTNGGSGKPHRADNPVAGSAPAQEQSTDSPGGGEMPPPSQAESHRPPAHGAGAAATSHGQEQAASNAEVEQETSPQPETPQLGEAVGTPPLPAVPAAAAA